ncbi:MAG: type II toxin-antitoxin system RelE/ParE family toxin [Defluviitaleaceae bacterium]|nr:type II toxin-antitoxin system RelE/ParE family toxin [Defluviitaleaceae bacterium]
MIYHVNITDSAETEMREIARYIADDLYSPQAALNLMRDLKKQIHSLKQMPERHALVSDKRLAQKCIRLIPIKNYAIFYEVIDIVKTVNIISIMYSGRDWMNLL